MGKSSRPGFSSLVSLIEGFLQEFQAETDRGTAVVAAAYLDDLLASVLSEHSLGVHDTSGQLLKNQQPPRDFAGRIKVSSQLGLIRQDQFFDLETIRKIRNEFAHTHQRRSFEEPPISELCDSLTQISLIAKFWNQMTDSERELLIDRWQSRRQKFVGSSIHLAVGLIVRWRDPVDSEYRL